MLFLILKSILINKLVIAKQLHSIINTIHIIVFKPVHIVPKVAFNLYYKYIILYYILALILIKLWKSRQSTN